MIHVLEIDPKDKKLIDLWDEQPLSSFPKVLEEEVFNGKVICLQENNVVSIIGKASDGEIRGKEYKKLPPLGSSVRVFLDHIFGKRSYEIFTFHEISPEIISLRILPCEN